MILIVCSFKVFYLFILNKNILIKNLKVFFLRLALEISLCDDQRNVLSRALVGLLDVPFDARPRWYRLHPWSSRFVLRLIIK